MGSRYMASLAIAAVLALTIAQPCRAAEPRLQVAEPRMQVSVNGHAARLLAPGVHIEVSVLALPPARHEYCLGLASVQDRSGLPMNLGRVARDLAGTGRIIATIPARLFPAEPVGPFLLFIGTCTPIAPDRPFLARTIIRIQPARTATT